MGEYIEQLRKYDELYTKFRCVTGMTVEEVLNLFLKGYVLKRNEYPSLKELGNFCD